MKKTILALIAATLLAPTLPASAAISGRNLLDGKQQKIAPGKKGTVVVFLSSVCPCSGSHVPVLKELATKFPSFAFVAVHSNADETDATAKEYFQKAALPFPVLRDAKAKLADSMKAERTPHAFLLSPSGKVLYKGGVTSSSNAASAEKNYLQDALAEVEAGKPVQLAEGRLVGCDISRPLKKN